MLATGMIRKIDRLGRIVIPKEIRRSLKIDSGDDLEFFAEDDCLILKKFQAIYKYNSLAKIYCNIIYDNIHTNCFICSKEKTAASSSDIEEQNISGELLTIINKGENILLSGEGNTIPLFAKDGLKYLCQCISPVKYMGDIYGAIIAYSTKREDFFKESELSLIYSASLLLCGQL